MGRIHQVMEAVVAGRSNKQVAADLALSIKTVESRRARVVAKMEASSLSELVAAIVARASHEGKP